MIIAVAFTNYDHKEMHLVDTGKLSAKTQKLFHEAIQSHEISNPYSNGANPYVSIEKFSYNQFYDELQKAFVTPQYPMQIDGMVVVKEYDEMDHVVDSW